MALKLANYAALDPSYPGSGMRRHSAGDEETWDEYAGDADLLRQAVGGMLSTLLDSLLMFCPNANSYRRFQTNSYAPLAATWSSCLSRRATNSARSFSVNSRVAPGSSIAQAT